MAKQDITDYIEEVLSEHNLEFDWLVQWNKRQHVIEVFFTIYSETDSDVVIEDIEGTVNKEQTIQFEDAICFYDPEKSKILLDNYLQSFPFDIKKGMEKGFLDAVIKQLRIVVTEGQVRLEEFASDPEIETFEMEWDHQNFDGTLKTMKETNRYNMETVPYPKF